MDAIRDILPSWADVQAHFQAKREEAWLTGYEAAAEVFLGLVAKSIDELQGKLGNLSKDEQVALSSLYELRRMAEAELAAAGEPGRSRLRQDPQDTP
jgi:hypothetical protein